MNNFIKKNLIALSCVFLGGISVSYSMDPDLDNQNNLKNRLIQFVQQNPKIYEGCEKTPSFLYGAFKKTVQNKAEIQPLLEQCTGNVLEFRYKYEKSILIFFAQNGEWTYYNPYNQQINQLDNQMNNMNLNPQIIPDAIKNFIRAIDPTLFDGMDQDTKIKFIAENYCGIQQQANYHDVRGHVSNYFQGQNLIQNNNNQQIQVNIQPNLAGLRQEINNFKNALGDMANDAKINWFFTYFKDSNQTFGLNQQEIKNELIKQFPAQNLIQNNNNQEIQVNNQIQLIKLLVLERFNNKESLRQQNLTQIVEDFKNFLRIQQNYTAIMDPLGKDKNIDEFLKYIVTCVQNNQQFDLNTAIEKLNKPIINQNALKLIKDMPNYDNGTIFMVKGKDDGPVINGEVHYYRILNTKYKGQNITDVKTKEIVNGFFTEYYGDTQSDAAQAAIKELLEKLL